MLFSFNNLSVDLVGGLELVQHNRATIVYDSICCMSSSDKPAELGIMKEGRAL